MTISGSSRSSVESALNLFLTVTVKLTYHMLWTDINFAVLKAALIAIRGTRGSLYQKQADEGADVDYNVVALRCKDDFLRPQCRESLSV